MCFCFINVKGVFLGFGNAVDSVDKVAFVGVIFCGGVNDEF